MDYLEKAQFLARTLPSEERIKLHRKQCFCLQEELEETLVRVVESCRDRVPILYRGVFKELHLVVQKVKTFVEDCCFDIDSEFVYAAIRATAHKERFFQYRVQLEWIVFLVESLRDASLHGKRQFAWEQKFESPELSRGTSNLIAADERHLKALLESWIGKPGEHQAICWTLLHRLEAKTDLDILLGDLNVPPITSTLGNFIGQGGYGTVYEIKWEEKLFAVKVFEIDNAETINSEVEILGDCCHPHIVNLILAHKKDRWQYLMMERLSMDLQSYVEKRKGENTFPFPDLEVVDMISQVCDGMLYLNDDKKVSHRDLKPRNILVKENLDILVKDTDRVIELQVADFGLAKVRKNKGLGKSSNSENTPNMGTTLYRAPEMTVRPGGNKKLRGSSMKADMYSFAVTCSFILTGREPFKDQYENNAAITEAIKRGKRPVLPEDCLPALSSLLQQCWHPQPAERPSNFYEIRAKLRELKTNLLTSAVKRAGVPGGADVPRGADDLRAVTFNSGDRPLRILALGDSELVATAVGQICGAVGHRLKDYVNLTESRSSSPPMCVYGDTTGIGNNFKDIKSGIKSFVKSRNNSWHQRQVEASWMGYLHQQSARDTLFGDSTLRLHMVWLLCRTTEDLPNNLEWSEITKEMCGLPVQILVIGTKGMNEDLDIQFNEIIVDLGSHFFPEDRNLEELIVKVDTTARGNWKEKLWSTCWTLKTRAEIENAAMVITTMRKKLGSSGVAIPVGVAARISPAFSLSHGGDFVLNFLCTYWDIPRDSVQRVLQRMPNFEGTTSQTEQNKLRRISIKPREFVFYCLQVAAIILDNASNPRYVYRWVSAELLDREAQACYNSYFEISKFSEYDQMTFRDIQAFLQSIFERKSRAPSPLVSRARYSMCSKVMNIFFCRQ